MVDIQGRLSSLALPLKMAVMIWSRAKQTSPRMMTREGPYMGQLKTMSQRGHCPYQRKSDKGADQTTEKRLLIHIWRRSM